MAVMMQESVATDEEVEFLNAIEKDLYQLTIDQAKIETAHERLHAVDDETNKDVETVITDDLNEEKGGKYAESVEYEHEEHVGSKFGDEVSELWGYDRSNDGWGMNYPTRPDAEDCSYYMKFGSCKFGLSCKFNHPTRRMNQGIKQREYHREEKWGRVGQSECKYYLTPVGCRHGSDCNYSHVSDKSDKSNTAELNFLGLPIRTGEKECPYYMRTGSCKYGSTCRYHHPEPSARVDADSPFGYGNGVGSLPSKVVSSPSVSSWSSPRAFNDTSPFSSAMFPPAKSVATSNTEWNGDQAATTYPTSESGLPTPPAFATDNLPSEINFSMPYHQQDMLLEEYPERPGEPACSFFLKTGDCKFKSSCKFHHPKNRSSNTNAYSFALSNKGLPLRPDQPLCTFYHRFGICKYGPACRFDHPSDYATSPPTFRQQLFGN